MFSDLQSLGQSHNGLATDRGRSPTIPVPPTRGFPVLRDIWGVELDVRLGNIW